jgi:hypothetical protein
MMNSTAAVDSEKLGTVTVASVCILLTFFRIGASVNFLLRVYE